MSLTSYYFPWIIFVLTVVLAGLVVVVTTEMGFKTLKNNSISAVMKGDAAN